MTSLVLTGFLTGGGLIVAVGAQNAFVLRQGLLKRHVGLVVVVCAASDLLLILAGVGGIGLIVASTPLALSVVRWFGVAFLVGYGLLALRRVVGGERLQVSDASQLSWPATLGTCLVFTWLNPHVYLDTVLLLGSLANQHGATGRWWFAAGAGLASVAWFSLLGFGSRLLTPIFQRPTAWRVLDAMIAVLMLTLAASLAFG